METKPLKHTIPSHTGSVFTHALQVMFTFAKYTSQNGHLWTHKGEGTEPRTVISHCKNSGRPRWSCVPLPKATCFLFCSSIKWHLWRNQISFKCWKPHTFGEQGVWDDSTWHHQQRPHCSHGEDWGEKSERGWGREEFFKILGHFFINYVIK